jgi:hypothetical protein
MKRDWFVLLSVAVLGDVLAACSHLDQGGGKPEAAEINPLSRTIQTVKDQCAPDDHLAIFDIHVRREGRDLILAGEVDDPAAKSEILEAVARAGFRAADRIRVLPAAELGDKVWGIASVSVSNGREKPGHGAEMGTQVLMGHAILVWKQTNHWFLVQSSDRYLSWMQKGTFVRCTKADLDAWNAAPLLMVTALEDSVREQPQADAQPVSDVVPGCLLKKTGEAGDWFAVELPDRRAGYLPRHGAVDFAAWKQTCHATPDSIERTARTLLGRPYLWGGNSPKNLDCSGFTQLVFFLNGVELSRNASQQALQGRDVPLDADLSQLRKGDLLFFGFGGRRSRTNAVTHVGIYLGNKLFIQSSEMVRISSLDPQSPTRDELRIRTLLHARRVLPEP